MARACEAKIRPTKWKVTNRFNSERPDKAPSDWETCGGEIFLSLSTIGAGPCRCGDYCYCEGPEIHVDATCGKCRYPYFDGIDKLTSGDARYELERILNG